MTDSKSKGQRADRFGIPEKESENLNYFDEKGNRLSASEGLERVKEDAKKSASNPGRIGPALSGVT